MSTEQLKELVIQPLRLEGIPEVNDGAWAHYSGPRSILTKDGVIMYTTILSEKGSTMVVHGFVASKPYKPENSGEGCLAVRIRIMTGGEKRKYRDAVRRQISGGLIYFW